MAVGPAVFVVPLVPSPTSKVAFENVNPDGGCETLVPVVKVDVNGSGQWEDKTYAVKAREVYNSPKPDAAGNKSGGSRK